MTNLKTASLILKWRFIELFSDRFGCENVNLYETCCSSVEKGGGKYNQFQCKGKQTLINMIRNEN
jgi:hypothetical protein